MEVDSHPLDYYPEPDDGDEQADSLALIDRARSALAQAETLADIGAVREIAERARRYASAAKLGREAENHAARLRLEAERKAGALLAETQKNPGIRHSGGNTVLPPEDAPRLQDLGVTKKQSSDWQRMAKVPDEVFEAHVSDVARKGEPLTTSGVVQVARQIEKAERAAEPKPRIDPVMIPARVEVADARSLPLDDESVHLIVTSPPYAVGKLYEAGGDESPEAWSSLVYGACREMLRVSVRGGRLALNVPLDVTVGGFLPVYSAAVQMAMAAGWRYRSSIVWLDDQLGKSVARGSVDSASAPSIIAGVEMVALFSKGEWRREPPCDSDLDHAEWLEWTNGVWRFQGEARAWEGHPAPFPLRLPHQLVRLLSFPGDVVLDPFCGSGTTLLAAHRLGRQPVGYDRSPAYVESTLRRLAKEVAEGGRVPTDRGGSDADDEAGLRSGVRGTGAETGEPRGLRAGLHRGAAGIEQQELVSAGGSRQVTDSRAAS